MALAVFILFVNYDTFSRIYNRVNKGKRVKSYPEVAEQIRRIIQKNGIEEWYRRKVIENGIQSSTADYAWNGDKE